MSKFVDMLDREWRLELTMASAQQVEEDVGIDLLKWMEDAGAGMDNRTVFRIVGSLCADQIAGRDMTLKEFARGFDGGALERAGEALCECLLFFSLPQKAAKAALPKIRGVIEGVHDRMARAIEAQDFRNLVGDSPASADSTRGP